MKIPFSEITAEGLHTVVEKSGPLVEPGIVVKVKPVADVTLVLVDESTVRLDGIIRAVIDLSCVRCGQPVAFELYADYYYIFKLGEDSSLLQKDVECSVVYLDEPIIDVEEVLHEQLALSIPEKLLCSKDCKGLCRKCGALLASDSCSCVDENPDSPFAILKNM